MEAGARSTECAGKVERSYTLELGSDAFAHSNMITRDTGNARDLSRQRTRHAAPLASCASITSNITPRPTATHFTNTSSYRNDGTTTPHASLCKTMYTCPNTDETFALSTSRSVRRTRQHAFLSQYSTTCNPNENACNARGQRA